MSESVRSGVTGAVRALPPLFYTSAGMKGGMKAADVASRPGPAAAGIPPEGNTLPCLPQNPVPAGLSCGRTRPRSHPAARPRRCPPLSRRTVRWRAAPPCGRDEALPAGRRREGSGAAVAVGELPRRWAAVRAVRSGGPSARKPDWLQALKFYLFVSRRSDYRPKRTVCPALIAHLGQVAFHFHYVSLCRMIKKKEVWKFILGDPEGKITRDPRSCKHALGAFKGWIPEKE